MTQKCVTIVRFHRCRNEHITILTWLSKTMKWIWQHFSWTHQCKRCKELTYTIKEITIQFRWISWFRLFRCFFLSSSIPICIRLQMGDFRETANNLHCMENGRISFSFVSFFLSCWLYMFFSEMLCRWILYVIFNEQAYLYPNWIYTLSMVTWYNQLMKWVMWTKYTEYILFKHI